MAKIVRQPTRRIVKQNNKVPNNSTSAVPNNFRSRQLAEVLRILKRPALLESTRHHLGKGISLAPKMPAAVTLGRVHRARKGAGVTRRTNR